jgi:hypothetical protein
MRSERAIALRRRRGMKKVGKSEKLVCTARTVKDDVTDHSSTEFIVLFLYVPTVNKLPEVFSPAQSAMMSCSRWKCSFHTVKRSELITVMLTSAGWVGSGPGVGTGSIHGSRAIACVMGIRVCDVGVGDESTENYVTIVVNNTKQARGWVDSRQ